MGDLRIRLRELCAGFHKCRRGRCDVGRFRAQRKLTPLQLHIGDQLLLKEAVRLGFLQVREPLAAAVRQELRLRTRNRTFGLCSLRAGTGEIRLHLGIVLVRKDLALLRVVTLMYGQIDDAPRILHRNIGAREFQPSVRLHDIGGQGGRAVGVPPIRPTRAIATTKPIANVDRYLLPVFCRATVVGAFGVSVSAMAHVL